MPVLSRVQQNDIYKIAEGAGLDPLAFAWTSEKLSYRGLTEILRHRPTQARIDFSLGEKMWISFWPKFRPGDDTFHARGWEDATLVVALWMAEVKRNHDAPDLWGEAAKARELTDAAGHLEADNTPFDPAEVELLKPRLAEIEAYIQARQPLGEQQQKEIHNRFTYLLGAAKRGMGRVDWLNIFVSQIVQLFTNGILHSSLYGDVMRHATAAIGNVWKFGARLFGS